MKKILCVFLSLVMCFSCLTVAFAEERDDDVTPLIVIAGYASSPLLKYNEDGTTEQAWGLDFDAILSLVLSKAAQIGMGIGSWIFSDPQYLADVVGENMPQILDSIRVNPDGSSVYDLRVPCNDAEHCNAQYLIDNCPADWRGEQPIVEGLSETLGYENIYYLFVDFRMGAEFCAAQLDNLVESVCETTGKDKVDIFAISHGGQVSATYLNLYGDKGRVEDAVLIVPAIGGASLAADALAEHPQLDERTLLYFIESGFMLEEDYNWLVQAEKLGFLDDLIECLLPYFYNYLLYWGSLWDFVPCELYEDYKARLLDSEASAELIAKSDRMHYEIMPKMSERFKTLMENGTNISIIAGYNLHSVAGYNCNSDAIITTNASTGSLCADWGKRFNDGYIQSGTSCTNPLHNHVSPDFCVDASYAYIPDNTWFVDGFFHGMELNDPYTKSLYEKLILGDGLADVYADPEYPQFRASSNAAYSVFAKFNNSNFGILSGDDNALTVTNLTGYKLKILSVDVKGADFVIKKTNKAVKAGESIDLEIAGNIPEESLKNIEITVNYNLIGSITPLGTRTQDFVIMNGEAVEYDTENPQINTHYSTYFEEEYNPVCSKILKDLGIKELVEMLFNMFKTVVYNLKKLKAL